MKQIIQLFLIMVLLVNTQACRNQAREENNRKAAELLGNLYTEVKHREKSVNYHMSIQFGGCAFEVWVNDMPVYRDKGSYGSGAVGLSAPINTHILKSGVQTWEVRLYPSIIQGKPMDALSEGLKAELSVEALRFNDDGSMSVISKPVTLLETPKVEKDGKLVFADAGKLVTIYRGTFEADVPYTLIGWSESEDLTRQDTTALKVELVEQYERFRTLLENGQTDEMARLILRREQETAQCYYYNKEENDNYLNVFLKGFGHEGQKPYPLEKYKMVFYGNGRMVTLERTDMVYEPALATQYFDADGSEFTNTFYLYFHKPKGSDKLEVIR